MRKFEFVLMKRPCLFCWKIQRFDSSWTCECTCTEEDVFKVMDCTTRWSRELTTLVTLTPCFVRHFQFFPIIIHSRVAYCFDLLQGTLFIFFSWKKNMIRLNTIFFTRFLPFAAPFFDWKRHVLFSPVLRGTICHECHWICKWFDLGSVMTSNLNAEEHI